MSEGSTVAPRTQVAATPAPTLQDQVYDFVKQNIMNLHFKPGQQISDTQLATELNISRTPIRAALRRLEQEGLLVSQARKGWKVYTLSLKDINDIFDLKEVIDAMVSRRAAECQDEGLRGALREALEDMQRAGEAHDPDAWQEADFRLHRTIFEMADNERASAIRRNLDEQWHRLRVGFIAMHGRIERANPEHAAFVERILAGDGENAERLTRIHLRNVREELVRLLVKLVLPFVEEGV